LLPITTRRIACVNDCIMMVVNCKLKLRGRNPYMILESDQFFQSYILFHIIPLEIYLVQAFIYSQLYCHNKIISASFSTGRFLQRSGCTILVPNAINSLLLFLIRARQLFATTLPAAHKTVEEEQIVLYMLRLKIFMIT
jgi:hypothetical protein